MGFEIIVHYHPANENGHGWNQDVSLTKKYTLGKRDEDCSYTRLAKFCITQNARRDVYVFDFEVYQYVKKQITVKAATDARGGVVIKGKRFALDELQNADEPAESNSDEDAGEEEVPEPKKAPAPEAKAHPAEPDYDFVAMAKAGRIIHAGTTVAHPVVQNHVSCDYQVLPRMVFFQPSTPNAAQKYKLVPAKIYQVLGRFVNKLYWQSQAQSMNTQVLLQNESGNLVLVPELDLTLVPTQLPADVMADQRYDPDKIVKQQDYDNPGQASQYRAPQSVGEDDMMILRPRR